VTRVRARRLERAWSFPLGALRLSGRFLRSDPPAPGELRRLRRHVREVLAAGGVPSASGESVVGTGGTVRNLAKVDRHACGYPLTRVHGYVLPRAHVQRINALLAGRRQRKRDDVKGLSGERGDSIVGGGQAVEALLEALEAPALTVSGQGVREGLALSLLGGDALPSAAEVRAVSLASLCARFDGWEERPARRRTEVSRVLFSSLEGAGELGDALARAATLLDIGRTVDFFGRHAHAADILLATDLDGFTHREIALTAAVVRAAREDDAGRDYRPLLSRQDRAGIVRAGVLLALADDLEERCPGEGPIPVAVSRRPGEVVLRVGGLLGWRPRRLRERFESAFGRDLVVQPA
jgi:exopolyphosphatase/guanosine-5'-triphosphate,3'-diphosphate pyrophosphatase